MKPELPVCDFLLAKQPSGRCERGPKIIDASVKKRMKAALKNIQNGTFAKNWIKEYESGAKQHNASSRQQHPIEKTGIRLRALMPWIKRKNIRGVQAAY